MKLLKMSLKPFTTAVVASLAYAVSGGIAAAAPLPSYASTDESIKGTISSVTGKYTITVRDDRGFIDKVTLHDGTVINPTGLTLAAGQTVTIRGRNVGSSFSANEIDTPYESHGDGVSYAYGFPDNYGGPYWPATYGYGNGYGYGYPYYPGYGGVSLYFGSYYGGRGYYGGHDYYGGRGYYGGHGYHGGHGYDGGHGYYGGQRYSGGHVYSGGHGYSAGRGYSAGQSSYGHAGAGSTSRGGSYGHVGSGGGMSHGGGHSHR